VHRRLAATYLPPAFVGLLALPFILKQNGWWEWANAYWLLQFQTAHVSAHGLPTLFVHLDSGAFNPTYVFYAGPLFSTLAYPAAIVGPWTVFATMTVITLVCGYLGIWWTARNLGLSRELAILPALTFATTPYVLCDLYGRTAWAELIAVNALAVLVGGLTALVWRPGQDRTWGFAATVLATATIVGSHNLTMLMCGLVLPFIALALWPLAPRPARTPIAAAVGAIALGVGLTAAWLLPNLWWSHETVIAGANFNDVLFQDTRHLLDLSNLLSIWPRAPDGPISRWLFVQVPTLAAAWSVAALAPILVRASRARARTTVAAGRLVAVGVALFLLIADAKWWLSFPGVIKTIQFPYRLVPYFAIVVCLGMIIGVASLGRGRAGRAMLGALVLVVGIQAAGAVSTAWRSKATSAYRIPPQLDKLSASKRPGGFSGLTTSQFKVFKGGDPVTLPTARTTQRHPTTADDAVLSGTAPVGDLQLTTVVWSHLVLVKGGARLIGHDNVGRALVAVTRTDARGRWSARVQPAQPWPLVAGRIVSLLSAAIALALGLRAMRRRRRSAVAPPLTESCQPALAGHQHTN
jgi:hypothetical protein